MTDLRAFYAGFLTKTAAVPGPVRFGGKLLGVGATGLAGGTAIGAGIYHTVVKPGLQQVDQRLDQAKAQGAEMLGDANKTLDRGNALADQHQDRLEKTIAGAKTDLQAMPGQMWQQAKDKAKGFLAHPAVGIGLGLGAGALLGGALGGSSETTDAQGRPVRKRRMWPLLFGAGLGGLAGAGYAAHQGGLGQGAQNFMRGGYKTMLTGAANQAGV